jgi:hypothetical protein
MFKPDSGLSSEVKNLTYQSNKTNEVPDLTFLSKGQLRRMIEDQCQEIARLKNRNSKLMDQNISLMNDAKFYQKTALDIGQKVIEHLPNSPYISIAI